MRKSMVLSVVGFAVALVVILGAWLMLKDRGSGGDVVATPTGTASPTGGETPDPSVSVAPEPSPPVDGAIPVPAFPASAIPWDQVGPGWFLLSYDPYTLDDVVPAQTVGEHGPQYWFTLADESLMLVSPAGDLYYVRSLDGLGSVRPMDWTGDSVLLVEGHAIAESDELPHGRLDALDLATGEATTLNDDVYIFDDIFRTLADGRMVVYRVSYDGATWVEIVDPDFGLNADVCATAYSAISTLSPDGTRVVCLADEYPKSAVMLYNVVDGTGTKIDEFAFDPWSYTVHGWWDEDSFVVSRVDDSGTTLWWAYDVSTQHIRDLNATLADGTPAEFAEGVADYRVVTGGPAGTTVEVQDFEGTRRAEVPCAPRAISGSVALTTCVGPGGEMEMRVFDLESGDFTSVGSFVWGPEAELSTFPWPR